MAKNRSVRITLGAALLVLVVLIVAFNAINLAEAFWQWAAVLWPDDEHGQVVQSAARAGSG